MPNPANSGHAGPQNCPVCIDTDCRDHRGPSEHVVRIYRRPDSSYLGSTGADVVVTRECTMCHAEFHMCGHEWNAGCEKCNICPTCLDTREDEGSRHSHCAACRNPLWSEDDWACGDCGSCADCVPPSEYSESYCQAHDGHDEHDSETDNCECEGCRDDIRRGPRVIHDYSYREYPAARPANPKIRPFLYLGVELETEQDHGDINDAAQSIVTEFENDVILKHDSSLTNGYECVTGPFGLEEHHSLWPKLAPAMSAVGSRSWGHPTTGMHVHMSRDFFTPLMIGKVQVFLNSEETREMVVKLAGRVSDHYGKLKKKKLTDIYSADRYDALNLQNDATLEIRIFKGTLNVEHILANIEFCHALAYWVIDASVASCEHWDQFMTYVVKHRKLYQHLINYMSRFKIAEDAGEQKEESVA